MQKFAGVRPAEEAAGVWVRVSVWRIFMEFHGVPEGEAAVSFEGYVVELGEVKQISDGKGGSRDVKKVLS